MTRPARFNLRPDRSAQRTVGCTLRPVPAASEPVRHLTVVRSQPAVCDDCDGDTPQWSTPAHVWEATVRLAGRPDPVLCPGCFVERAGIAGFDGPWVVAQHPATLEASRSAHPAGARKAGEVVAE